MASQYKTKCPHCGAQFRISEQHLQQAGGKVRCGSCLEIFKATDHLVDRPAAKSASGQPPRSKPAAPVKPAAAPAGKAKPATPRPAQRWTLDDSAEAEPASAPASKKPATRENKPDDANDTHVSLGKLELSDSFLSLDEDNDGELRDESFSSMTGAARDNMSQGGDEAWAKALLEELEADDDGPAPAASRDKPGNKKPATPKRPPAAEPDHDTDDLDAALAELGDDDPEASLDALFEESVSAPKGKPEASDSPFDLFDEGADFDDDFTDVEMPKPARPRNADTFVSESRFGTLAGMLKWGSLSAAALVILLVQHMAFNFDRLARAPEWRPIYASVCDVLPCNLPNPSDVGKLRGSSLVVRSHPQVPSALVVDAIVFNHASYEQPFPVLELSFSTLRGRPVASRRFQPEEYLQGELANLDSMPRDVPVRVSFEILDPGQDAVNYRLHFHAAPEKS